MIATFVCTECWKGKFSAYGQRECDLFFHNSPEIERTQQLATRSSISAIILSPCSDSRLQLDSELDINTMSLFF